MYENYMASKTIKQSKNVNVITSLNHNCDSVASESTCYSPFNERMRKRQERYHIHLHISAIQVLKNHYFWKIKSSLISNLDRPIRNYYRNHA